MNSSQPDPSTRPAQLFEPPVHPLAGQMEKWVQLREQLVEMTARLETLHLMLRLSQR